MPKQDRNIHKYLPILHCLSIPYLGDSALVGGDVAEVSGVALPLLAVLAAVLALVEVEVRPGRGAAVGGVAELVDVEAVQPRLQVADLAGDPHRVGPRRNVLKRDVRQFTGRNLLGVEFDG